MTEPRTYPNGVTCWIAAEEPDVEAATAFYGELFGWTFRNITPPGAPVYYMADLAGADVGAVTGGRTGGGPEGAPCAGPGIGWPKARLAIAAVPAMIRLRREILVLIIVACSRSC